MVCALHPWSRIPLALPSEPSTNPQPHRSMSTASSQSRGVNRRINSIQNEGRHSRNSSVSRRRPLSANVACSHALRVAYLAYLLHPRSRRIQNVPAAAARPKRSSTSIHDLMSDFSLIRDSKSTRIPHGFVAELEKRLTGVLMGKEKRKEYQDHLVVRTFAAFLNTLKEDSFRKRMEKDRRAEDLVLIFYSNAIKELSKGKEHDDDSWKLMVDRHVALFVRLLALILKSHDWAKDRPELANRLSVLENKLLLQDQDLMEGNGMTTTEVVAPLSYDVKDMTLVQHVAKIFGMTPSQAQSELDKHKSAWNEKAALQDLKTYQTHLNLQTHKTLSRGDFETDEAFEAWKKSEGPDLSQMMLAIVQSNPELAKSTPGALPAIHPTAEDDLSRTSSGRTTRMSHAFDQPVDLSSLSMGGADDSEESDTYTFIPSDPREVYRHILSQALSHDLRDRELEASQASADTPSVKLLSKQSTELLNEICLRWRIPNFSRVVLFLDVIQSKFVDNEIDLNTLDSAFTFIKESPSSEPRSKRSSMAVSSVFDRQKWTVHDLQVMQASLSKLHEAMLRELYDVMMDCFEAKPRPLGPVMYILENHIQMDPNYTEDPEDINRFSSYVQDGLAQKATEKYQSMLGQLVPVDGDSWEFENVIQLGDSIAKLALKIQKRYRNNPEIMG